MNGTPTHAGFGPSTGLSILPVLSAQLKDTAHQVERSVVSVCSSFQEMAARARNAVKLAREGLGGRRADGRVGGGMDEAVHAARYTLEKLLARVVRSSELSGESAARVAQLEASLKQINSILNDVDRMTRATRILALNAAIEAARFGNEGKSFGVVAKEISQVAADSDHTSQSIRQILRRLATEAAETSQNLQQAASHEVEDAQASRGEVEAALEALASAGRGLEYTIEESSVNAERLAGDINDAVVALQFQDAVGQRIGHVVEALDQIAHASADPGGVPESAGDPARSGARAGATLAALEASYTMQAEREAQVRAVGGSVVHDGLAGSVELF